MKKIFLLMLLGLMLELPTAQAKAASMAKTTTIEAASDAKTLRKKRRNRQRKGFMWGLFRKRNACDCPKH